MTQGPGHIVRSPDFEFNGVAYAKGSFVALPDESAAALKKLGIVADPTPEELGAWQAAQQPQESGDQPAVEHHDDD